MKNRLIILALIGLLPLSALAVRSMSDGEVKDLMIKGTISEHEENCPCPYNKDKNENECGENSLYIQSGGKLNCFPSDITDNEVKRFRKRFKIPRPEKPWEFNRERDRDVNRL